MNPQQQQNISKCCKSPLVVIGSDDGTYYWKCTKCGKPSDPFAEQQNKEGWVKDGDGYSKDITNTELGQGLKKMLDELPEQNKEKKYCKFHSFMNGNVDIENCPECKNMKAFEECKCDAEGVCQHGILHKKDYSSPPPQNTGEEWEKEFERKFMNFLCRETGASFANDVKSFISQTISAYKESILAEVEEASPDVVPYVNQERFMEGFLAAKRIIISKLSSKK